MRWIVADSLYHAEQMFCSHVDSYTHYLRMRGEEVTSLVYGRPEMGSIGFQDGVADVAFVLDRYESVDQAADLWPDVVRIAQVAAVCSPMPWEVRRQDGSPAYDMIISSLEWMVAEARRAGCKAVFQKLAFDQRALTCGQGVERNLGAVFIGTIGPNHVRRTRVLRELSDVVTIGVPQFGRDYFRSLARAKVLVNVHAEWARGEANAMRLYEGLGMGCVVVSDGKFNGDNELDCVPDYVCVDKPDDIDCWRQRISEAMAMDECVRDYQQACCFGLHSYEKRAGALIRWAYELVERKRGGR